MNIYQVRALMPGSGRWTPDGLGVAHPRNPHDYFPAEAGAPAEPIPHLYLWSVAREGEAGVHIAPPCNLSRCRHMTAEAAEAHYLEWSTEMPPSFSAPDRSEGPALCQGCGETKPAGWAHDRAALQSFRLCAACVTQETFRRLATGVPVPRIFRVKH